MSTIRETLLKHVQAASADKSLLQVASDLDVQHATIYRWLKGERSIDINTAEKLAKHFGLELKPARKRK